ncbi:MAG TPA: hypothetical protein VMW38_20130, partial [Terriglobia bacterium]|nr:hypothetical protein [Terriglobia bacterium]
MQFNLKLLFPMAALLAVPPAVQCQTTGATYSYYFAHIATGSIWRTTFTYVNLSDAYSTCDTSFYSDSGGPLKLSFGGIKTSIVHYSIQGGGTLRGQTDSDPTGPVVTGWALGSCTGPMKASALFRSYKGDVPEAEGSVLASTNPASQFVTYSDQITGVAYANPLSTLSTVTFTARNSSGQRLATKSLILPGGNHGNFNVGAFLNLDSFPQGSLEVDATSPIILLSLDFESSPVFSALPPGEDVSGQD